MMKNINYQTNENLTISTTPRFSLVERLEQSSELASNDSMELLAGGSINYTHYDNKARLIRSSVSHGFLRSLLRLFSAE